MITISVMLALVLLPMTGDQAPTNKNGILEIKHKTYTKYEADLIEEHTNL